MIGAEQPRDAGEQWLPVLLQGQDAVEGVCGLVEIGGDPAGLDGHQVPSGAVHDGGEHGDGREAVDGLLQDDAAAGADEHGEEDGGPAVEEDGGGVAVPVGQPQEDWQQEGVGHQDHQAGQLAWGEIGERDI